ncbi:MAG: hypothetical protein K8Q89_09320 [Nitrosarchaeum sp.]|nr:hypothetical protein [Nitrosarchaeum sp.]
MVTWEDYELTDIPFRETGHIDTSLMDVRLNGKIFSKDGFEPTFDKLLSLISKDKSVCYLRSHKETRGTGKSTLLAAVYWHLKDESSKEYLPTWVTVHDYRTVTHLFSRILDTFVTNGVFTKIHEKLEEVTVDSISSLLSKKISSPSPSVIDAVAKILSVPDGQLAWKYQNIRRSIPFVSPFEIFSYIMMMYSEIDSRKIIVFIDQFEEYVQFQRQSRKLPQLAEDLKDIYRMCSQLQNMTFVLTLHPVSESDFESAGKELLHTYGNISENAADLEEITNKQLVSVAVKYLKYYRAPNAPNDIEKYHPFTKEAIDYIAEKSHLNCRTMIRLLHNALMEAREEGQLKLSLEFIKDPKTHEAIGLGVLES